MTDKTKTRDSDKAGLKLPTSRIKKGFSSEGLPKGVQFSKSAVVAITAAIESLTMEHLQCATEFCTSKTRRITRRTLLLAQGREFDADMSRLLRNVTIVGCGFRPTSLANIKKHLATRKIRRTRRAR